MRQRPALAVLALIAAPLAAAGDLPDTSCTVCHSDADLFDTADLEVVELFAGDVHREVGLSCHDCHGGNPDAALADDLFAAMDPDHDANPYRGAPAAADIPGFCGRCHSDPTYMKRFLPDARVDQEREYRTSHHGKGLAQGDPAVATCVSCHGVHGIRRASDPESSIYPTRVAETCGQCHANAERMSGYVGSSGKPLSIDQLARWQQSVHAKAMHEMEDLTAPTCNDCHGNHGAAPPGLESVTFVCGQCHGREAELFRGSPKHAGFEAHNEYLTDAGEEGCTACHDESEPQARLAGLGSFGECTSCHGNHGIVRPTVAMFGALPGVPCAFCHDADGVVGAQPTQGRDGALATTLSTLLAEAQQGGIAEDDLFDWLVDRTLELPQHSMTPADSVSANAELRPEFARLFSKFRIGKSYYTYDDPESGVQTRADVIRCGDCHGYGPVDDDARPGATGASQIVEHMAELTVATAEAERLLLAARRGGVEAREALLDVDRAVDSQVGLEVLVHSFSVAEDSQFMTTFNEGQAHAEAASAKGRAALDELAFRRRGLAWSLVVIVLALVALGLKIRQLPERE